MIVWKNRQILERIQQILLKIMILQHNLMGTAPQQGGRRLHFYWCVLKGKSLFIVVNSHLPVAIQILKLPDTTYLDWWSELYFFLL